MLAILSCSISFLFSIAVHSFPVIQVLSSCHSSAPYDVIPVRDTGIYVLV
ncbi:MAG: hypothetical protein ACEY3B_01785 [Wolbachia sp.]